MSKEPGRSFLYMLIMFSTSVANKGSFLPKKVSLKTIMVGFRKSTFGGTEEPKRFLACVDQPRLGCGSSDISTSEKHRATCAKTR